MRTLRGLADDGRTVVVVTHSVANLDLCDRLLLLAPGGTVAFFGPPQEALAHFGKTDFADVFLALQEEPDADWGGRFRHSPAHARYVGRPAAAPGRTEHLGSTAGAAANRQQSVGRQLSVLCRRYLAVIAADRQYLVFMAALPLVLSLLAHALPGDAGLSMSEQLRGAAGAPNSLWLVLVIGAALMGSAASIRELVKEREIYRRERAIGLSRGAYLASKLVILGVVVGLQSVLLGVLGTIGRPPPDAPVVLGSASLEIVVALAVLTVASMAVGLAVSALIDNADRGMPLLVLLAMLQFILSSALLQIGDRPGLGQLAWLVPARWGFAAGAATIGLPTGPDTHSLYTQHDALWDHTAGNLAPRSRRARRRDRTLRRGDLVAAAPTRPAAPMTAVPVRALARAMASDGRSVALAEGAIVVGRDAGCDLAFPDESRLSRRAVHLEWNGSGVLITNLSSHPRPRRRRRRCRLPPARRLDRRGADARARGGQRPGLGNLHVRADGRGRGTAPPDADLRGSGRRHRHQ